MLTPLTLYINIRNTVEPGYSELGYSEQNWI